MKRNSNVTVRSRVKPRVPRRLAQRLAFLEGACRDLKREIDSLQGLMDIVWAIIEEETED